MLEISCKDDELFNGLIETQNVYKNGVYDFTFEKRFIIYHADVKHGCEYYAYDKKTGYSSTVTFVNKPYEINKETQKLLIPKILFSIKYTGDTRYLTMYTKNPVEIIDAIFRVILPANGYTIREEQIKLCKDMYYGFTEKQVAICEAEVGTGKTLAYLVAAFAAKVYYEYNFNIVKPVTISTATIELQKHIVENEIPNLSKILLDYKFIKRPFITTLRKGKEHYLCNRRLLELEKDLLVDESKHSNMLAAIELLKKKPYGIDLDKYSINESLKKKVCVKSNCERCKEQTQCEYSKMINKTFNSPIVDFQVTNHNLYLLSHKNKKKNNGNTTFNSNFVVLDEAHRLKDVAQDVFGEELTEKDVVKYITNVKTLCNRLTSPKVYKEWIEQLLKENKKMFETLKKIPVYEDESNDNHIIIDVPKTIGQSLKNMIELVIKIDTHKTKNKAEPLSNGEHLINTLKRLSEIQDNIMWLDVDENNMLSLCCCPQDIDLLLKKKVWDIDGSHVLTSGTMSDGTDFEYFKSELGIDLISHRLVFESSISSPFDYKKNTRLYLPKDITPPDNGSEKYIKSISNEILKLINATNGHTAILFTSYKVLELVHERIEKHLEKYDVIKMTRGNRNAIEEFKKSRNGILFASGSMWEGVDCIGDCLSSVIIVKLPFPMRNVVSNERKKECESIPEFIDRYCTPDMIIKLRQGIGRLVRCETDTGVISILDTRVNSKAYSQKLNVVFERYKKVNSIEDVQKFIESVKDDKYKNS